MPAHNSYSRWLVTALLATTLGAASINLWVNPLRAFPWEFSNSLDPYRTAESRTRSIKSNLATWKDWDIILLGSSRVETGIPTDPAFWQDQKVANLALSGTCLLESEAMLKHVLEHTQPKLVLLGLHASMCTTKQQPRSDYALSGLGESSTQDIVERWIQSAVGSNPLRGSAQTLRQYTSKQPAETDATGWRQGRRERKNNHRVVHRQLQQILTPSSATLDPSIRRRIQSCIDMCHKAQVELILFIPPMHASALLSQEISGKDRQEHVLANIMHELSNTARLQGVRIQAYNFRHMHPLLADRLPNESSTKPMSGWFETSHFRADPIGAHMISRMLQKPSSTAPDGFGIALHETVIAPPPYKTTDYKKWQPEDWRQIWEAHSSP